MNVQDNVIQLKEFGPVKEMEVPRGWIEKKLNNARGDLKSFVKYHHPDNVDVQICLFYKGLPVSDDSALLFSKVLASQLVSLTIDNLDSLQEILGNLAIIDEFEVDSAKLIPLNEKKVLLVEGNWIKLGLKSKSYFIDAREDGSIVYELYYAAPIKLYDEYIEAVDSALETIQWQKV